ncbi:glycosyltransferase [Fulvivirga lutea]|uniref:Glycosyltransferase n=1 Tax=Fulvivirga lutea TaxID=2810512 RepID=A0A974WG31_9BACT|nr:glycosyltransferase [Fulvivirga lutea]QSE97174.1 glycosyltransferase [Fulvivirga lutea]
MIYFLIGIASLALLVDICLLVLWKDDTLSDTTAPLKKVSVLIAARNEAANIKACLQSLIRQDYPNELVQILVGDDQSEDETYQLAKDELQHNSNSKVLKIERNVGHQKGKANVLAQLANQASGDVFLITDADMQLPASWVRSMVGSLKNEGIVTGVTYVEGNNYQSIDWIFSLGIIKVLKDVGQPVTTMGNNMMITKKAYQAVGGYESIPFSITEDFELFKHVRNKGFDIVQLFNPAVLGKTKPVSGFINLLNQRKRWMKGAVQLPKLIVLLLLVQALYFPALILLISYNLQLGLSLMIIKILFQTFFILRCLNSLELKYSFGQLIIYEFYSIIVSLSSAIYYLLPAKVSWKGRKY